MQVRALSAPQHESVLQSSLVALIEAVGTSPFESDLFRLVRRSLRCAHFSVFSWSEASPPSVVIAASGDNKKIARRVGESYVARSWKDDPINQICLPPSQMKGGIAIRVCESELAAAPHRRECYSDPDWHRSGAKLIDRYSIVRKQGRVTIRMNFYRDCQQGLFENGDLNAIGASANLFFALMAKHTLLIGASKTDQQFQTLSDQIRELAPSLSWREIEVCAGIAAGMTSEAIGLNLGISINTVLTYRKRAYGRLGISSQNELFRMLYQKTKQAGQTYAFRQ